MTTAEMYAAPTDEKVTTLVDTSLLFAVRLRPVSLTWGTTQAGAMSPEVRAALLRQLVDLSFDPNSMDRHSEVDIWGFHNDS
jgi:hypothetical protein